MALSALPSLLVALCLVYMPESPKYLVCRGREAEAVSVLRRMFSLNTGRPGAQFPCSSLASHRTPHIVPAATTSWSRALAQAADSAKQLFSGSLAAVTLTMVVINFAIQFGYYGLWLWFPELFNKLEKFHVQHPNQTLSVCEVVSLEVKAVANSSAAAECTASVPDQEVFINSFIISMSAAPTNLWTIYHMDKLGRKFFLVISMLLSGCSAFFIYLVNSAAMNLALSCVFGAVSTMGFNSLDCLGIELFPTQLRSTAMAVTLVSARLGAIVGNLVFGYLVESHCATPILMVAGLLFGRSFSLIWGKITSLLYYKHQQKNCRSFLITLLILTP